MNADLKGLKKFFKDKANFVLSQWFFIALAVLIVIARFAPNFARNGGLIKAEYTIGYGVVALIFLQSGLSMSTKSMCLNLFNWRAHVVMLVLSFLVTSSILFGFCYAIRSSGDETIDKWVLVGMIMMGASPTTVASNVIMTRSAGGNDLLSLCEVFIGNVLGGFLTPAIAQMYLNTPLFKFGNPTQNSSMRELYASVMKQIGCSVLVPLFVGQVVQNIFPQQVKWTLSTFKLNKLGSICLLLIMFSSYSTAFYQHAFTSVSHVCIIFILLFNLGIYLFFSVICFFCARPFWVPRIFPAELSNESSRFYRLNYEFFRPFFYGRKDTVAILYCGPAKTAALGVWLITAQYGSDFPQLGKLLVPFVLYQSEQVVAAKLLVPLVRKWALKEVESDERNMNSGETSSLKSSISR
ncbi:LAMI_0D13366g1_1 [Lachancea mirantina]|uniref:LAMI_0D13366g1_1 n=1 Tax=Lachancea mirantina TaxID=1230905 RepID=A0A1G4JGD1_9SACH|nr:LAMI_0D13366g1_1 [Lachancea mirantina]